MRIMANLKNISWLFPLIGGIMLIMAFLTPAAYRSWSFVWIWGVSLRNMRVFEMTRDIMRIIPAIVSSILVLVGVIVLVNSALKIRKNGLELEEFKKKWLIGAVLPIIGIIIWMIMMELSCSLNLNINRYPFSSSSCFRFWGLNYHGPGFGVIGIFLGAAIPIVGVAILSKVDLEATKEKVKKPKKVKVPKIKKKPKEEEVIRQPEVVKREELGARFCPTCGTSIAPENTFCGNCGADLERQEIQPPKSQSIKKQEFKPGATPSMTQEVSDGKLFRGNLFAGIMFFFLASWLFGLSNSPFTDRISRIGYIITGVILTFGGILNIVIYATKPESLRRKYLKQRAKKEAKKARKGK